MAATMGRFPIFCASSSGSRDKTFNFLIFAFGRQTQLTKIPNGSHGHQCSRTMSMGPPCSQGDNRHKISNFIPLLPSWTNRLAVYGSRNGFSPHRTFLWKSFFGGPTEVDEEKSEKAAPTKPKRPPNVFILYWQKVKGNVIRENPDIKHRDILKKTGEMYANLDPKEKAILIAEYEEKNAKYLEAKKIYEENITPEQIIEEQEIIRKKQKSSLKRTKNALGKPNRGLSGFAIFQKEVMKDQDMSTVKLSQGAFKSGLEKWRNLDEATKKKYNEMGEKSREEAQKKLDEWENRMIAEGHYNVLRKSTLNRLRVEKNRSERKLKTDKKVKKEEKSIRPDIF